MSSTVERKCIYSKNRVDWDLNNVSKQIRHLLYIAWNGAIFSLFLSFYIMLTVIIIELTLNAARFKTANHRLQSKYLRLI